LLTIIKGISGPLSRPSVPDPEVVKRISLDGLLQFRDRHLRGGNVVVGGVGVESEDLVEASKIFEDLKPGSDIHDFPLKYHGGDCTLVEGRQIRLFSFLCLVWFGLVWFVCLFLLLLCFFKDPAWRARQLPGADEGLQIAVRKKERRIA
jgi:hypothetical protein